jgi:hypothetical protein
MNARDVAGWLAAVSMFGVAACGAAKAPVAGIDYGAEDAEPSKADSATRPASLDPIALDVVTRSTLDAQHRFRGFVFEGREGQRVNLYADGLGGIDTVLSLYKVSRRSGKAYGPPVVTNDDTEKASWVLLSNGAPNDLSSSAVRVRLPETRRYAIIVTTYRQRESGDVEVRLEASSTRCDAAAAARRFVFPNGVPEEGAVALELQSEAAATSYADPQGRTVRWLVREGETNAVQKWISGYNDLWAQRFEVSRSSCVVKVTAEH